MSSISTDFLNSLPDAVGYLTSSCPKLLKQLRQGCDDGVGGRDVGKAVHPGAQPDVYARGGHVRAHAVSEHGAVARKRPAHHGLTRASGAQLVGDDPPGGGGAPHLQRVLRTGTGRGDVPHLVTCPGDRQARHLTADDRRWSHPQRGIGGHRRRSSGGAGSGRRSGTLRAPEDSHDQRQRCDQNGGAGRI